MSSLESYVQSLAYRSYSQLVDQHRQKEHKKYLKERFSQETVKRAFAERLAELINELDSNQINSNELKRLVDEYKAYSPNLDTVYRMKHFQHEIDAALHQGSEATSQVIDQNLNIDLSDEGSVRTLVSALLSIRFSQIHLSEIEGNSGDDLPDVSLDEFLKNLETYSISDIDRVMQALLKSGFSLPLNNIYPEFSEKYQEFLEKREEEIHQLTEDWDTTVQAQAAQRTATLKREARTAEDRYESTLNELTRLEKDIGERSLSTDQIRENLKQIISRRELAAYYEKRIEKLTDMLDIISNPSVSNSEIQQRLQRLIDDERNALEGLRNA